MDLRPVRFDGPFAFDARPLLRELDSGHGMTLVGGFDLRPLGVRDADTGRFRLDPFRCGGRHLGIRSGLDSIRPF